MCVPSGLGDEGPEACRFAGAYGIVADVWQALVVGWWLRVRDDGRWAASRCGLSVPRQNGKNTILEVYELYSMVVLNRRVLHTAHEVKTARKAFIRLLSFFENPRKYPELAALVKEIRKTNGQEAIVLHSGGSVEFIARSKGSGRGFSVDDLVCDEAQEMSNDQLAALRPTISASDNPKLIMTGTPPGPLSVGEVFLRTRKSGISENPGRLCWAEWSAEPPVDGELIDWLDPAGIVRANPGLGVDRDSALRWETIVDEQQDMDEDTFARERGGMWSESSGQGLADTVTKWAELVDSDSCIVGNVVVAVDVSPMGRTASLAVAGRRSDGVAHVEHVVTRRGIDWVRGDIDRLVARHGAVAIIADKAGPAGAVLQDLADAARRIMLTSATQMGQACGGFVGSVNGGQLRHIDQPALSAALGGAKTRRLGDAFAFSRSGADDITPLVAVVLALWGLREWENTPSKVPNAKSKITVMV